MSVNRIDSRGKVKQYSKLETLLALIIFLGFYITLLYLKKETHRLENKNDNSSTGGYPYECTINYHAAQEAGLLPVSSLEFQIKVCSLVSCENPTFRNNLHIRKNAVATKQIDKHEEDARKIDAK